ncbi:hypothetical protein BAL199_06114 [alpha proteobacterium BAL199]|jgi:hypothetical protein|nr:hypothetical protein BAL199_06114 [alpha proteobacterium BAL199]
MFFKARSKIFDDEALADLRACADDLLDRANRDRTSLGHFVSNASARARIVSVAHRFYECELPALFATQHGAMPVLNLGYTTIRFQAPEAPDTQVGWHLDLNFVGDTSPFMVAWVPLEDVGAKRIGLEVCVPTRTLNLDPLLDLWSRRVAERGPQVFTDQNLADMFGADAYQVRALPMSAGSGAVFDQFVLHRTQLLPNATESRRSFEFRMADLGRLPQSWNTRVGLFCQRDDAAPSGIGFLIKRDGQPCRPISDSELDALDISYGA